MRFALLTLLLLGACSGPDPGTSQQSQIHIRHPQTAELEESVRRAIENGIKEWVGVDTTTDDNEERAASYAKLGKIYLAHNFYEPASDALRIAIRHSGDHANWHYFLGVALRNANDIAGAIDAFGSAIDLQGLPSARWSRANLLLALGDLDAAREDVKVLLEDPSQQAAVLALAGQLALASGQYEQAEKHYRAALKKQPAASKLQAPLGLAMRQQDKHREAAAILKKAGDTDVIYDDPLMNELAALSRSVQYYVERGQAFMGRRQFENAAREFAIAVDLGPSDATARATYGRALEILGQASLAKEQYQEAIRLQPHFPVAHYFLGAFLERHGEQREARQHYQKSVDQDPEYAPPRLLLAHSLLRTGDFQNAIVHYQHIAQTNKRNVQVRYYHGLASLALQDCDTATTVLESASNINPNYGPVLEALSRTYAICSEDKVKLDRALEIGEQLNVVRPDAASAETLAMVFAARNDFSRAAELIDMAIDRSTVERRNALEDVLNLYRQGSMTPRAWSPDAVVYNPPLLTATSLE